jgi:hypothetical protein
VADLRRRSPYRGLVWTVSPFTGLDVAALAVVALALTGTGGPAAARDGDDSEK